MISEEQFIADFKEMLETKDNIELDTDLLDIEAWNSLSMMQLIVMVEEKYGIKVQRYKIAEAVLVEDLYEALFK